MVRYLIFALTFFLSQNAFSEILWFRDIKTAKAISMQENKLILVDFWATWCGPCKDMESKLWDSEEFKILSENFVPLKVDVDQNPGLATKYQIQSIPTVLIINAFGEVIHTEKGFSSPKTYLNIFEKLPNDVKALNISLIPLVKNEKSEQIYYEIGLAYQELGINNDYYKLKDAFFDKSNVYFKKARSKENSSMLNEMSDLEMILNLAYRGKTKQANKKLTKLDASYSDPKLMELYNFILAYCYKMDGDNDNFLIKKKLIEDEYYLSQLDG